jgi:hypothetical protein
MAWLNKYDYLCGWRYGGAKWKNSAGDEVAAINFGVSVLEEREKFIEFEYSITNISSGEKENFKYKIKLVSTPCNYGRERWWFICQLSVNGVYCGRRVGTLYLPPNGKYFGCRHCYDLTYRSCRESHQRDSLYKSIAMETGFTPKVVKETLNKRFPIR